MSIYDKPVTSLTTSDLQELLDDDAVENVRLEFKLKDPDKDETLKKLSSFANTFGGYLIIGALADSSSGRLQGLPGIKPISGFKQRIAQWCYESISPPIQPYVSDPIKSPNDPSKVCYVIYVDESQEAPHFLNSRRGVYVRTDEFSQRFEPKLATFNEIQHLANRRSLAEEQRKHLLRRSHERFNEFVWLFYPSYKKTTQPIGATLKIVISPVYPVRPLIQHDKLQSLMRDISVQQRRVEFPSSHLDRSCQHESIIILDTRGRFEFIEANIWGQFCYAREVEGQGNVGNYVHVQQLVGALLLYLEHARRMLLEVGFDGTLRFAVGLERVLKRPFFITGYAGQVEKCGCSILDDEIAFQQDCSSEEFRSSRDRIAVELLRTIFYAVNWPEGVADEASIAGILEMGYKFNLWKPTK